MGGGLKTHPGVVFPLFCVCALVLTPPHTAGLWALRGCPHRRTSGREPTLDP